MSAAPFDCPLCGRGPRARVWRRHAGHTIRRCGACGLLVTWPRPTPEALRAFYDSADYYETHAMGAAAASAWDERARGLLLHVPQAVASVLDFGAGEGHAVAALRRLGLRAEGVEPAPRPRAVARERHGLTLAADIDELPADAFDLALLIHSLEHVCDPVGALRAVASRVRPEGFVLIEVPHARAAALWTERGRERVLHLPAHLVHFVPETLAAVVARAGLRVLDVILTNPDSLERLFARRARRRGPAPRTPPPDAVAGAPDLQRASRAARAFWARSVLPFIRRRFPGYKFQVLARRPA